MMAKPAKHFYEFGAFRIDLAKRRLLRDGEVVPLTPKAFDTLLVLVENCGRVVEKDDLMEKVWPDAVVEKNNLSQNISALRKALGEKREEPHYILTVSGQGYRFVASVTEYWGDKPEDKPEASAQPVLALIKHQEVQSKQTEPAGGQPSVPAGSNLGETELLALEPLPHARTVGSSGLRLLAGCHLRRSGESAAGTLGTATGVPPLASEDSAASASLTT